ncbi:dipeptidase [Steroidobacter agaridevorans]|uniref:Dipeptidase n=1 Tax=Steroidobacter agaridevorans TaxID=2695856 RepID=A0A829YKF1_9GAMM|nr:dipeptidase [Steroidobacter agaridevorans]GFE83258.1 dipeptidase [Steroidobacter agaridevorans]GFE86846.1 dipeptidase [Steroidobacter agaridevorans]
MTNLRRGLLAACGLVTFAALSTAAHADEDKALAHARQLLKKAILVDGHNDLPWAIRIDKKAPGDVAAYDLNGTVAGQTDLKRLDKGGIGAQFWSVYIPGEIGSGFARTQLEQIDIARRMIERYPKLQFATTVADIRAAHREGRIASLMGMEGGHAIENSLGALRAYYELGVRYMTLTHNVNLDWADSAAKPPEHGGLTKFGEDVVLEMNKLGMLVDLAHVSDDTMDDALRVSKAPVIFSHSSARAICDVPRNVPDSILKRLPENGGVVMVTFVAGFIDPEVAKIQVPAMAELSRRTQGKSVEEAEKIADEVMGKLKLPKTNIAKVADHIEHIRKVAGVKHIGLGGDYDGNSDWPVGLEDVSSYPLLFAELIRRGWSDEDLTLLAGENVLRALAQAENVSRQLSKK